MKKRAVLLIMLIIVFAGVVYWHGTEQRRWSEWRLHQLYMVDLVQNKMNAGWSEDSVGIYSRHIEDSLYLEPPTDCPYCIVKRKLNRYGRQEHK